MYLLSLDRVDINVGGQRRGPVETIALRAHAVSRFVCWAGAIYVTGILRFCV